MQVSCTTPDKLQTEVRSFIKTLQPKKEEATLITLSGTLGAGKTAFVKALAREMGVLEFVTSPTFVLEKVYTLPKSAMFTTLVHIDAYRLENPAALEILGFKKLMRNHEALILFEWPERVEEALPKPAAHIIIEILPDESRRITYA